MKTRPSPGSDRARAVRRVTFWTAMALAAVLLISLFVRAQRQPESPAISHANDLHAELAAAAPPPPAEAPPARKRAAKPPRAAANPSANTGLKLIPVTTDDNIKRVELTDKTPPADGLVPAAFTIPALAPPAAATPEPSIGWGAWNQPPPDPAGGPGGLRHIPGLNPSLTATSLNADSPNALGAAPRGNAPGGDLPGIDLPGLPAGKANGWHHGHFDGGTLQAHQHGNSFHKAHPRSGR